MIGIDYYLLLIRIDLTKTREEGMDCAFSTSRTVRFNYINPCVIETANWYSVTGKALSNTYNGTSDVELVFITLKNTDE